MRMRHKPWAVPELSACPDFVQEPAQWKGRWQEWFPRRQPLHVELGCGKGTFLADLACRHPDVNYLGIDLSRDVLAVARRNIEARYAQEARPVENIALTAHHIERILEILDAGDPVERLYINFCNPWPRGKHQKKRLTHTRQLETYRTFLQDGARLHFKTDDDGLFLSTLRYLREAGWELLWQTKDLHRAEDARDWQEAISTEHEDRFTEEGIPIKALVARYRKASAT